ncbi:MAG: DUF2255 family protein [Streptosporangiaceae bacterium]
MTSPWSINELETIGAAAELSVAPRRPDGRLRPSTTIWMVRVGDDLYVRSYNGTSSRWYQAAARTGSGRITAGGIEHDVSFEKADAAEPALVDRAYRAKCGRSSYVDAMVSAQAAVTTLRLIPSEPAV